MKLGLPGAIAQPRALHSGSQRGRGAGVVGSVVCGLVPGNPLQWTGGGASVGLLSMRVAVMTAGGMCCVHHSTVWIRAVRWSRESQRAGLLPLWG